MWGIPLSIIRKRLVPLEDLIGELKTIDGIRQANKVGRAKAYKGIPRIIDKLAQLWRPNAKYRKTSYAKVDVDASGPHVYFLGADCPSCLKRICKGVLTWILDEMMKTGDYWVSWLLSLRLL